METSTPERTGVQLSDLPVEILQKTACLLDAESVLALTRTCRIIRKTCYATIVFRTILEQASQHYDVTYWMSSQELRPLFQSSVCGTTSLGQLQLQPLAVDAFADNSTRIWADIAVAGSRAIEEVANRANPFLSVSVAGSPSAVTHAPFNFGLSLDRLLYVAPHFIFFKHPIVSSHFVAVGLSESVQLFRRTDSLGDPRLALWYCASMLTWPAGCDQDMQRTASRGAFAVLSYYFKQQAPVKSRVLNLFALGAAVTAIRLKVLCRRDELTAGDPGGDLEKLILTPTVASMSFQHLRNHQMPPLLSGSSNGGIFRWNSWLADCTSSLGNPAYVDHPAGWSCYFLTFDQIKSTLSVDTSLPIGRPWRQVKFQTRKSEFNASNLIIQSWWDKDEADGIYGLIGPEGRGRATVLNTQHRTFDRWDFSLTLFGLFGRYQTYRDRSHLVRRPSTWEIEHTLYSSRSRESQLLQDGVFWMWREEYNDQTG